MAPERDQTRVNERIRIPEVRVIGPEGEQLGVMTPEAGIEIAREHGLDLVEVAPGSRPPVCRVMDYGRYKYEQKKRQNEARKKQTTVEIKEIKIRPKTDSHDIEFYEGKEWRTVRKIVAKCEAAEDEADFGGLTIQWIERVERWHDQEGGYMEDDDYETMWSRNGDDY